MGHTLLLWLLLGLDIWLKTAAGGTLIFPNPSLSKQKNETKRNEEEAPNYATTRKNLTVI